MLFKNACPVTSYEPLMQFWVKDMLWWKCNSIERILPGAARQESNFSRWQNEYMYNNCNIHTNILHINYNDILFDCTISVVLWRIRKF